MRPRRRVLVVDDSPVVRDVLCEALATTEDLETVGQAADGLKAIEMVRALRPDVVTMDVVMPLMSGLEAARRIAAESPTPIVMVADAGDDVARLAFEALTSGAVDVFPKPHTGFDRETARRFVAMVREACNTRRPAPAPRLERRSTGVPTAPRAPRIVGIVGSTGAPGLLPSLLGALPRETPWPVVIVQHTVPGLVSALAAWVARSCAMRVRVGARGHRLVPGEIVFAPDGHHTVVSRLGFLDLEDSPPVGSHRPAGNVLLRSLARSYGADALGVVLSGMGADGAEGLAEIAGAGGSCVVQDPRSAVVDAMPTHALRHTPTALTVDGARLGGLLATLARSREGGQP